ESGCAGGSSAFRGSSHDSGGRTEGGRIPRRRKRVLPTGGSHHDEGANPGSRLGVGRDQTGRGGPGEGPAVSVPHILGPGRANFARSCVGPASQKPGET